MRAYLRLAKKINLNEKAIFVKILAIQNFNKRLHHKASINEMNINILIFNNTHRLQCQEVLAAT